MSLRHLRSFVVAVAVAAAACSGGTGGAAPDGGARADVSPDRGSDRAGDALPAMTFFVTSTGNGAMGGNLGGVEGADARCRQLAMAVGAGDRTWVAWLSVERGPGGTPLHAKDRVGPGPWHDSKGRLIAATLADLLPGPDQRPRGNQAAVDDLLDENGTAVPKSPTEHDILTGTLASGLLAAGHTCGDWKSTEGDAQVGHADNRGPFSWTESHLTMGCTTAAFAINGGVGRFYCFARR